MKINSVILAIFSAIILTSGKISAQCNFTITNHLTCDVKVDIRVYDNPACGVLCYSSANQIILASTQFTIPCAGGCPNVCDVWVKVVNVGGTPVTVNNATFANPNQAVSTLCGATNTIDYDGVSDFLIHY